MKMLNIKTICACFVWLMMIVLANTQVQQLSPTEKIERHFYHKCFNMTRDLLPYQKLYADTTQFMGHMATAFQLIQDKKKQFCETERGQLNIEIMQVAKDLTPCLLPEEQYLSKFVESFVKELLYFLCRHHGENIDRLFSGQGRTCRENINKDNSSAVELEQCFGKIFPPVSDKFVTKRELCDNMDVARKCLNIIVDRKCPHEQSMHDLNENFFKFVGKTCSGCVKNYLSTLLLIMSIVLPFTLNLKN